MSDPKLIPVRPGSAAMMFERERGHWMALDPPRVAYSIRGVTEGGAEIELRTLASSAAEAIRSAALAGVIIDVRDAHAITQLPRTRSLRREVFWGVLLAHAALFVGLVVLVLAIMIIAAAR